jgi:hypothetical protein
MPSKRQGRANTCPKEKQQDRDRLKDGNGFVGGLEQEDVVSIYPTGDFGRFRSFQ